MANLIPKSHIILRQRKPLTWQLRNSDLASDASIRWAIGRFSSSIVAVPPLRPRFRFHSLSLGHSSLLPLLHPLPLLRLPLLYLCSPISTSMINSDDDPSPDSTTKTVRLVIKGRVQGVFYRDWTVANANELGLKGWVRNRRDGSVEALFSGTPQKVDDMEQRCRRGPPQAMVTGLQVFPSTDDPGASFEQDVKEGHFAVHTIDHGELSKSVVELSYLTNPGFLKLLEQAEEEYGFGQIGILSIPCGYSDLQTVLGRQNGMIS